MKPKFNIQAMKEYMGIAMFLFMALFSTQLGYGYEEIVTTREVKDAVFWNSGAEKHDGTLEYVKVDPNTPEGQVDSVRISFRRNVSYTIKGKKPAQKVFYRQKWTVTLDSLKINTIKNKCKIFVDGVYKKDTIVTQAPEYLACGPMTLLCYDYRDANNTPVGRSDELINKGYSILPISESFYNWLNNQRIWPTSQVTELDEDGGLFSEDIYLTGSDSTYVAPIDRSHKIVANVTRDRMEILFVGNNSPIKHFTFSKDNKSHTIDQYTQEKGEYTRVFAQEGETAPFIEVRENDIVFVEKNLRMKFMIDGSKIFAAIKLAKIRNILGDDNDSTEEDMWNWFGF